VRLDTSEIIDYDGVLVANGHLWDPKIPSIADQYTGKQIHSRAYRNTGDISGDRVATGDLATAGGHYQAALDLNATLPSATLSDPWWQNRSVRTVPCWTYLAGDCVSPA
jgi:cation diffusion facilitator CzcD-associated flavoprotein CzcO